MINIEISISNPIAEMNSRIMGSSQTVDSRYNKINTSRPDTNN
jgi:hypothetical protein